MGGGAASPTLLNNLGAYWALEETSGDRVDSVNSYALTEVTDGAQIGTESGKPGTAINFNTTLNEWCFATKANVGSSMYMQADTTVSFWTNPDGGSTTVSYILGIWEAGGNNRCWLIRYTDATDAIALLSSSSGADTATQDLATSVADTWTHFALVWDEAGNEFEYFVNGSTVGTTSPPGTGIKDSTGNFVIGNFGNTPSTSTDFDGGLDEVGVWNRKLTAAEILSLYNGGAGITYPFAGT
jgi:hypothetical protein